MTEAERLLRDGYWMVVAVVATACAALTMPAASRGATAATTTAQQNRAVLVVETGEQVKKVCVRFWEESISGAEMLRRADVDAAMRPYAGKGVAVCALCGVGCPTDDSCLTCDPDGRYWAYSRAPAGTSSFRLSPAGASNTQVHNGDVEGWRWSRGTSPGYISVEEVCDGGAPAAPATATTAVVSTTVAPTDQTPAATAVPAGPGGTSATTVTSLPTRLAAPGPARTAETKAPAAVPTTSPSTLLTPSSQSAAGAEPTPDSRATAPRRAQENDSFGSAAGLVAFAALMAGLLGWAARARSRRAT